MSVAANIGRIWLNESLQYSQVMKISTLNNFDTQCGDITYIC